ncbi:MAG: UDP-N-acetylmuramoyl-L-alanyl-D-glutamate--2,6-diaminopimelate ligase, partial [Gemmatimonadota bacterium]|nr:UDP-N-acetylmuramoyl-L-alanyl-D-glutamate--2,6-diaminopimelate ligase [Gemmatimonadota bacterium]
MRLRKLLSDVPNVVRMRGNNPDIGGIATHSGRVKEGDVFVALSGDGSIPDRHPFIFQAVQAGARAVVAERDVDVGDKAFIQTTNTHRALAHIARRFYNRPCEQLKMIGVTGTNGKTSTVYLIRAVLEMAGLAPGLIGTIEHDLGTTREISHNSTPQAHDLHRMFRVMVDAGCRSAAMEVTSHGLAQNRVLGIDYEVAVFTNLTRDHLDYHNTPDAYLAAKARLFDNLKPDAYAVVNTDDAASKILIKKCSAHLLNYGRAEDATVRILDGSTSQDGTRLCLQTPHGQMDLKLALRGDFQLYNATAAVTAGLALEIEPDIIADALRDIRIPGRFEGIECGQNFGGFVDYAHA